MGFLSVPNLIPRSIFKVNNFSIKATNSPCSGLLDQTMVIEGGRKAIEFWSIQTISHYNLNCSALKVMGNEAGAEGRGPACLSLTDNKICHLAIHTFSKKT